MKPGPHQSQLPRIDSIGYRTMVWMERERGAQCQLVELQRRRLLVAHYLRILATAFAFFNDGTILRGMQLELD